jgi:flagellar biosynthesis/type III secretory pathway protein FliH
MALALLKTPVGVTLTATGNLIKRSERVAVENVAEIVPGLFAQLEETRRHVAEKMSAAAEEHRAELAEMTRTVLVREVHALRARFVSYENQIAERFNDSVIECLRRLIGEHFRMEFVESAIHTAITANGFVSNAKLVVSAVDEHIARTVVADLQRGKTDLRIVIEADPRLSEGTCWFITAGGKVDASLQTQLHAIHDALAASGDSTAPVNDRRE